MSKPDFSGTWIFSPDKSDLQIRNPDKVIFKIEHDEPSFALERTLTFGEKTDTFRIDLIIGLQNAKFTKEGARIHPSLHWEENILIFKSKIIQEEIEASNIVRYQLKSGGKILEAHEVYKSPAQSYENRWVFKRE